MLLESIWSHIFLMPEKESITWGLPNYLNIVDLPYFCHYCYCTPPPTYLNLPLDWDFAYQFFPVGMPFPLSSVLTFHYSLTQPHSLSGLHFSTLRSLYIPNVSDPQQQYRELHSAGLKVCPHLTVPKYEAQMRKALRCMQETGGIV